MEGQSFKLGKAGQHAIKLCLFPLHVYVLSIEGLHYGGG